MAAAFEDEILALEKRFWTSMMHEDVEDLLDLIDEPSIIAGAQGVHRIDKSAMAQMFGAASWRLNGYNIPEADVVVRRLNEDTAAIAYKVYEDLTVDGRPVTLMAADTSIWIRKNGHWVCSVHTEAPLGDPFGRDRIAAR